MHTTSRYVPLWLLLTTAVSCDTVQQEARRVEAWSEEVLAIERAALDRWITGDPWGYLDLYASEVTYFDPNQERRVNGLRAMEAQFAPLQNMPLPFTAPRYEIIEPHVQVHGQVAVLTFNVVNYGRLADAPESILARWNATEVYRRVDGDWRIIHSHWSYVKPQPNQTGA